MSASPSSNPTSVPSRGQVDISVRGVSTEFVWPLAAVLGGIALLLAVEIIIVLMATHGHLVYPLEAAYTHLALAEQISVGHYGLVAGEAAAPSSSILYPFLLAALRPFGLGVILPLVINLASTLAAGVFAVLLARECRIPLHRVPPLCLFVLAAVVTLALDLPGLAMTGLEHSFHVAMTVAYLLGLVKFVVRGRCDWWWIACIIIQPIVDIRGGRDAGCRRADLRGISQIRLCARDGGDWCPPGRRILLVPPLFGLPLLPSSVLARSDWSNAAAVSHSGLFSVIVALLKNLNSNLNSFGAAQMLGAIVLGLVWLSSVWTTLSTSPP